MTRKIHLGRVTPVHGWCGCGREAMECGMCRLCRDLYLSRSYKSEVPFWRVVFVLFVVGTLAIYAVNKWGKKAPASEGTERWTTMTVR